jgi:hypothetical protein
MFKIEAVAVYRDDKKICSLVRDNIKMVIIKLRELSGRLSENNAAVK